MQKSRRWRGLEFHLLSLIGLGCAAPPAASPPAAEPRVAASAVSTASEPDPGPPSVPPPSVPPPSEEPSDAAVTSGSVGRPETDPLPLPKGTLVLQLGDSFAAALGIELGKLLKAEGLRSALEFKTASYIPNWSYDGDIPKFIATYHPDLVLITLGANEIEIPNPELRARPIRHLVSSLGGRPCVWVAPPLWKPDTGLLQVIRDNIAPCRYLDSNALLHDLPRGPDKIHPSSAGRELWAKTVFAWLANERLGDAQRPWALKPDTKADVTAARN